MSCVVSHKRLVATVALGMVNKTTNAGIVVVNLYSTPCGKRLPQNNMTCKGRMLLERVSLAGIARVLQISEDTVQRYVNAQAAIVPQQVEVSAKPKKRLTVQMDELWSFVDDKGNEQSVWLALDAQTREIVGVHVGDRSAVSAQALWNSMPPVYRQCSVIYSDHWSAYGAVLPKKRHRSVDKDSGFTSYIERFNCTLRQRVSRLVRKCLSFSKKLDNHIAAIWNFVHHYNATRRRKLGLA